MANLVNAGILPLTFKNESDYDKIEMGDEIVIDDVINQIKNGDEITAFDKTKGFEFKTVLSVSERQKEMLYAGGLLNYTKMRG